jgi:predicted metal-dependent phosphoesterase TrpH
MDKPQMIVDLHCHTDASDGTLSPPELVSRAVENGVETLAITDHDTVDAYARIRGEQFPEIKLIHGIELSTRWRSIGIHIVGLDIDLNSESLQTSIRQQQAARLERAATISRRLAKRGIDNALEGALAIAGKSLIGRPHFAQFLIAQGYVDTFSMAFKKYLGAGKAGDVKQMWPEMRTVIHWIREAGGIAVLAHPAKYKLTRTKLTELTQDFKADGGTAIEVISGQQPEEITRHLAKLCAEHELLASCGSDFHSPDNHWSELGRCGKLPDGCQPVWETW